MPKRDVLRTLKDAESVALRELDAIRAAISAIEGAFESGGGRGHSRPRKAARRSAAAPSKRRRLSPAARKRISDAQKARWAKQKAAKKD